MNKNKNNSIIFLTTLSVYLGLVLVGGAMSPILTQAATTRNFDIQDEIEFKDDLDNKPKDNEELTADAELIQHLNIVKAVSGFLEDLRKLKSIGKFNSQNDWNISQEVLVEEYGSTNSISNKSDFAKPWLKPAVEALISSAGFENLTANSDYLFACGEQSCRQTDIKVESSGNDFVLSFSFTKANAEKAQLTAKAFDKFFAEQKLEQKDSFSSKVYENTKATSENNQVVVVTRLPRGSLDTLLKQDAKAEK